MPSPLSAVGAISPAFEQTRRQLFQPFRFAFWARLGVVSLVTGEFVGGGWGGGASGINIPSQQEEEGGEIGFELLVPPNPVWQRMQEYLPWILAGVVALVILGLIAIYISSVYRFILLDAVLRDRCNLGEGWRRWQQQGSSFFLWVVGFGLAMLAGAAVLVGGPVYLAWRAGVFRQPSEHVGLLVGGGVALFFLLLAFFLLATLAAVFAKDFVVPLMALEELGVLDAWRRLLPMLGAEKTAYAGYVLMKIVLAVGSSMLFGIINLFVLLAMFIAFGNRRRCPLSGGEGGWTFLDRVHRRSRDCVVRRRPVSRHLRHRFRFRAGDVLFSVLQAAFLWRTLSGAGRPSGPSTIASIGSSIVGLTGAGCCPGFIK